MHNAHHLLLTLEDDLNIDFNTFFPELKDYVESEVKKIR